MKRFRKAQRNVRHDLRDGTLVPFGRTKAYDPWEERRSARMESKATQLDELIAIGKAAGEAWALGLERGAEHEAVVKSLHQWCSRWGALGICEDDAPEKVHDALRLAHELASIRAALGGRASTGAFHTAAAEAAFETALKRLSSLADATPELDHDGEGFVIAYAAPTLRAHLATMLIHDAAEGRVRPRCANKTCVSEVPPERDFYCSERCRQTVQKRAQRARVKGGEA